MLDAQAKSQLTTYLDLVTQPIELVASLDEGPASAKMRDLLTQIADLSDKVTVVEEPDRRTPSFAIRRVGTDIAVRFAGLPMGHEFASLVLALVQVGGHPPRLAPEIIDAIRALPGGNFTTYMSLTCQNCPTVVQALNTMSVINPAIRHTAVEGGAFRDEIDALDIQAVPTVFKDGEIFGQGRMDIDEFIALLDTDAADRTAAALNAKEPFDVLIVGGGPAGAAAAVYSARKALRTGILAERFGGQVLDTDAIENLISVPSTTGTRLGGALEEHVRAYDVDITTGVRAAALHVPSEPTDSPSEADSTTGTDLFEVDVEGGGTVRARSVILATGARFRTLGVPGEQEYRNKGVTFCPHCDGPLFAGQRVAVIGGGNSGIEAAIDLAGVTEHVALIEFLDELRADAVLIKALRALPNVDILTGTRVLEIAGNGKRVTGIDIEDHSTGETRRLDLEGVFVQIGLLPNTEWLEGLVDRNRAGEIVTDMKAATSVPGVFAAGDCSTTPFKQIVVSIGSGATAALAAFDHLVRAGVATPSEGE